MIRYQEREMRNLIRYVRGILATAGLGKRRQGQRAGPSQKEGSDEHVWSSLVKERVFVTPYGP